MLNVERTRTATEGLDPVGIPYVMVTERLSVRLSVFGGAGIGASYVRPRAVQRAGRTYPIPDVVAIAKLAGLLAVFLALFIAEVRK